MDNLVIWFAQGGNPADTACEGLGAVGASCGGGEAGLTTTVQGVIRVLLFVVGVAAVIMLIIGGIRYILSGGDSQAAAAAKNTVIYAIIGIIVAVLAWAIVNFVFGRIGGA
jgi:hypothetical protein